MAQVEQSDVYGPRNYGRNASLSRASRIADHLIGVDAGVCVSLSASEASALEKGEEKSPSSSTSFLFRHGGDLVALALKLHNVQFVYTLSGGHICK